MVAEVAPIVVPFSRVFDRPESESRYPAISVYAANLLRCAGLKREGDMTGR